MTETTKTSAIDHGPSASRNLNSRVLIDFGRNKMLQSKVSFAAGKITENKSSTKAITVSPSSYNRPIPLITE